MSARMTILAVTGLVAGAVPAHAQGCAGAIAEFVKVIDSDAATGNLNKGVHRRMTADLPACGPLAQPAATPRRHGRLWR